MKTLLSVPKLAPVRLTVARVASALVIVVRITVAVPSKLRHLFCHILRPAPSLGPAFFLDIVS